MRSYLPWLLLKHLLLKTIHIYSSHADKGNIVVVLENSDYINKMESSYSLLSDINSYMLINRNPVNKVLQELKAIANEMEAAGCYF